MWGWLVKILILLERGQDMAQKKIEVIPYLSFKGDCENALHIYFQAFGGEILFLSR